MKSFLMVFVFLLSAEAVAKNKVLFVEKLADPKVPPSLYVLMDYKRPGSKKLIENNIGTYASSADLIAYTKDDSLYIIVDFENLTKIFITDKLASYEIKDGVLFYTKTGMSPESRTLYAISDFKNLTKIEVVSGFSTYQVDIY